VTFNMYWGGAAGRWRRAADHVLTTPDIRTVSIKTGPNVGSDHLPIIAVLRLPGS